MKIEDLDDLSSYGISKIVSEMTGSVDAVFDWSLAGSIIEKHKINLTHTGATSKSAEILSVIRGHTPSPWSADIKSKDKLYMESGENALAAIGKAYIAYRVTEGYDLEIDPDEALNVIKKTSAIKMSLKEKSSAHEVSDADGLDNYTLTPLSSSAEDLEAFQGVVRLARKLQGDGVTIIKEHKESDSGGDCVDLLLATVR